MDMRKLVGQNVRRIRLKKGLTQEQFAELSGYSQQYISSLEQGKRNPTVITVYELAMALETSHLNLLRPSRNPTSKRSGSRIAARKSEGMAGGAGSLSSAERTGRFPRKNSRNIGQG